MVIFNLPFVYLPLEAIITVFKEDGYNGIRFTWVIFFNIHYKVSMCLIENFLLNLQVYKAWVILYFLWRKICFLTKFCPVWFQNQVSFQFVIGFTLAVSVYIAPAGFSESPIAEEGILLPEVCWQ